MGSRGSLMINRTVVTLTVLVFILALAAALAGVLWNTPGQPYPFTSLRGDVVQIEGRGLYHFDSVSAALQSKTQDVVTLVLGLPMLAISLWFYRRGGLRGKLLLAGTLANFFYVYILMAVISAFNPLFLVYVFLFSASFYGMILVLVSVDVPSLPLRFSPRLPRRTISVVMILVGAFLLLSWLGRIIPPTLQNTAPVGLDIYSTLPVQALDLGLLAPLAIWGGVAFWRNRPAGYLVAGLVLVKAFSFGTAVAAMGVTMLASGIDESVALVAIFSIFALVNIVMTVIMLRCVQEKKDNLAVKGV
jgi:hypothetical protein